ncbi:hypothetical protein B5S33_g2762 [[Candida] boidinii]|nr:hypothetical protein B5S33_g2762 [[Candida] boidinii]
MDFFNTLPYNIQDQVVDLLDLDDKLSLSYTSKTSSQFVLPKIYKKIIYSPFQDTNLQNIKNKKIENYKTEIDNFTIISNIKQLKKFFKLIKLNNSYYNSLLDELLFGLIDLQILIDLNFEIEILPFLSNISNIELPNGYLNYDMLINEDFKNLNTIYYTNEFILKYKKDLKLKKIINFEELNNNIKVFIIDSNINLNDDLVLFDFFFRNTNLISNLNSLYFNLDLNFKLKDLNYRRLMAFFVLCQKFSITFKNLFNLGLPLYNMTLKGFILMINEVIDFNNLNRLELFIDDSPLSTETQLQRSNIVEETRSRRRVDRLFYNSDDEDDENINDNENEEEEEDVNDNIRENNESNELKLFPVCGLLSDILSESNCQKNLKYLNIEYYSSDKNILELNNMRSIIIYRLIEVFKNLETLKIELSIPNLEVDNFLTILSSIISINNVDLQNFRLNCFDPKNNLINNLVDNLKDIELMFNNNLNYLSNCHCNYCSNLRNNELMINPNQELDEIMELSLKTSSLMIINDEITNYQKNLMGIYKKLISKSNIGKYSILSSIDIINNSNNNLNFKNGLLFDHLMNKQLNLIFKNFKNLKHINLCGLDYYKNYGEDCNDTQQPIFKLLYSNEFTRINEEHKADLIGICSLFNINDLSMGSNSDNSVNNSAGNGRGAGGVRGIFNLFGF